VTKVEALKNNPRTDLLFKIVPYGGPFPEHILPTERKPLNHFNNLTES
jgi:hypothetical protein